MTPDPLPVALPELPTVAWRWPSGRLAHFRIDPISEPKLAPLCVALVRKSDAEAALRAQAEEVAALRADAATWSHLMKLLINEQLRDCFGDNAPGHAHERPGIWDDDNGELAGKPCAWCATWNAARAHLAASKQENRP